MTAKLTGGCPDVRLSSSTGSGKETDFCVPHRAELDWILCHVHLRGFKSYHKPIELHFVCWK